MFAGGATNRPFKFKLHKSGIVYRVFKIKYYFFNKVAVTVQPLVDNRQNVFEQDKILVLDFGFEKTLN